MKSITTKTVIQHLEKPQTIILDVRPIDAYNGWRLQKEPRGGHITGAKTLPYKWSHYIDWMDILHTKNITPDHTIILYGYTTAETEYVAQQFTKAGYPDIHVYHHFPNEWTTNPHLPMQKMPRYPHLIPANWLHTLITTNTAPEYTNKRYVICHAHYQNRLAYEDGHIPYAIDLDTNLLESSDTWNRRSPQELQNAFKHLGITHNTTVILYGRFSHPNPEDPFPGSSAGHLGAMRCAFIMLYAGVTDIRILNGGLQAWLDAGYQTTTQEYPKKPVKNFGITIPQHPELAVDLTEAQHILASSHKNLISVRSWNEFTGAVSGYHYIKKKGRIPGAIFGNCGTDAYHMQNYRNLDHTTREHHEIEQMWAAAGITPTKHNSFYCGTGWRGSEAFINAWLMGWNNISVFDGGWYEWSTNNLPYETGIPQETSIPQTT